MTRTLIRKGLVITASDEITADVLIEDEKVVALADPAVAGDWTADTVIDATGRYVIPGGVDAHTHMELPFGGTFASDTFETGTRRRPGAAPPRSSTSRCSRWASRCARASTRGTPRPTASARSTTRST
jgi:imidazolonepropionase-like amidohydrolase